MMKVSIFDFKKDIESYFNKLNKNKSPLQINCEDGSSVVVMSLEEYKALADLPKKSRPRISQNRSFRNDNDFSMDILD